MAIEMCLVRFSPNIGVLLQVLTATILEMVFLKTMRGILAGDTHLRTQEIVLELPVIRLEVVESLINAIEIVHAIGIIGTLRNSEISVVLTVAIRPLVSWQFFSEALVISQGTDRLEKVFG